MGDYMGYHDYVLVSLKQSHVLPNLTDPPPAFLTVALL